MGVTEIVEESRAANLTTHETARALMQSWSVRPGGHGTPACWGMPPVLSRRSVSALHALGFRTMLDLCIARHHEIEEAWGIGPVLGRELASAGRNAWIHALWCAGAEVSPLLWHQR